jgi:hypothetical protein
VGLIFVLSSVRSLQIWGSGLTGLEALGGLLKEPMLGLEIIAD